MIREVLIVTVSLAAAPAVAQDSAQVAQGRALYAEHCVLCHGADGKRGEAFQTPIWGNGTMIASKFGHAQGLFEYLQMLMPFQDPSLVTDEQKLAVVAYMLANHGALPRTGEVTSSNLASIAIK